MSKPTDTYILQLRPTPGNWPAPPEKRLARLLKCALRSFGWRCVVCRPQREQSEVEPELAALLADPNLLPREREAIANLLGPTLRE